MTKSISKAKSKGFTIVELLVVIVVIGILAAITIVSYAGISNKAKTTKAQSNASSVQNVANIYFAEKGYYPASSANGTVTSNAIMTVPTTAKVPAGITVAATALSATNGESNITVSCKGSSCTDPSGLRIGYWDFTEGLKYLYTGDASSSDTTWTPAA